MSEPRRISVTEATELGVSGLINAAEKAKVIHVERHGKPFGVIISPAYYEELETIREDLLDTLLLLTRMATDNGNRTTLDQLLEEFGEDREALMAEVEKELRDDGLLS